jgi:hypothetical protein
MAPQSPLRNAAIVIEDDCINAILPRVYSETSMCGQSDVYDTSHTDRSQTDRTSDLAKTHWRVVIKAQETFLRDLVSAQQALEKTPESWINLIKDHRELSTEGRPFGPFAAQGLFVARWR